MGKTEMGTERFLNLYRTYEGLLREHGKDYKSEEDTAPGSLQDRMRIMRQMRNYLSHNEDPGFLCASKAQILLLEQLIKEERLSGDILKKHLTALSFPEGGTVKDAIEKMAKKKLLKMAVYREGRFLGMATLHKLILLSIKKGPECPLDRKAYGSYEKVEGVFPPETEMSKILKSGLRIICCTSDGTMDGKFLGIWECI